MAPVYVIPVRHSGGPLGLTLTLTLTSGMADPRNGGRYRVRPVYDRLRWKGDGWDVDIAAAAVCYCDVMQ